MDSPENLPEKDEERARTYPGPVRRGLPKAEKLAGEQADGTHRRQRWPKPRTGVVLPQLGADSPVSQSSAHRQ